MLKSNQGLIISQIIYNLNLEIQRKNKELVKHNLYKDQTPLHGVDMVLRLSFLNDEDLSKIARAANV